VATLEPAREPGSIQKERSALVLQLESGRSLRVNGRPLVMRVHPPDRAGGRNGHGPDTHGARTFYRLRIMAQPEAIERAQDVAAAGAQDEGPSALPEWGASAAR